MDKLEIAKAFGAIFAIMNPFTNLPIFLAMTDGSSLAEQRRLTFKITFFSIAICAVVLLAGRGIISFFGITVDEFRVAGGIVMFNIAWMMLNGKPLAVHHGTEDERAQMKELDDMSFYPMTFPMIVGPGTITTIIIYSGHAHNVQGFLVLGAIVGSMIATTFILLFFATEFGKVLSEKMRLITTRLMGMLLLAIAVEMVVTGIANLLPGLTR